MTTRTRAWTLASRPTGLPEAAHFEMREFDDAPLAVGEVRVRDDWLTVSPAMRVRMSAQTRGYLPPFELGAPLAGSAVGEVIASRAPALREGDRVLHMLGMRDFAQGAAAAFEKLPDFRARPEHFLNALGTTGFTAYVGIVAMSDPEPGETLFVSAAAGAVGSVGVQIGKVIGLHVVGSAGGSAKCALVRELGADAAIDYKSPGELGGKLLSVAPEGIDIYLDNVGGDHLDAALGAARPHARFAISGMIGSYNQDQVAETLCNLNRIVTRRIRIAGYLSLDDHPDLLMPFREKMQSWLEAGEIRPLQTVREGLDAVPPAFRELFTGGFTGKMLIRL